MVLVFKVMALSDIDKIEGLKWKWILAAKNKSPEAIKYLDSFHE
jgi:hypothetical protein